MMIKEANGHNNGKKNVSTILDNKTKILTISISKEVYQPIAVAGSKNQQKKLKNLEEQLAKKIDDCEIARGNLKKAQEIFEKDKESKGNISSLKIAQNQFNAAEKNLQKAKANLASHTNNKPSDKEEETNNRSKQESNKLKKETITIDLNSLIEVFLPIADKKIQNKGYDKLDPTLKDEGCHLRAFALLQLLKNPDIVSETLCGVKVGTVFNQKLLLALLELTQQLSKLEEKAPGILSDTSENLIVDKLNKLNPQILCNNLSNSNKDLLERTLCSVLRGILIDKSIEILKCSYEDAAKNGSKEAKELLYCLNQNEKQYIVGGDSAVTVKVLPLLATGQAMLEICKEQKQQILINIRLFVKQNSGRLKLEDVLVLTSEYDQKGHLGLVPISSSTEDIPSIIYDTFTVINLENVKSINSIKDQVLKKVLQLPLEDILLAAHIAHPQYPGDHEKDLNKEGLEIYQGSNMLMAKAKALAEFAYENKIGGQLYPKGEILAKECLPTIEHVYLTTYGKQLECNKVLMKKSNEHEKVIEQNLAHKEQIEQKCKEHHKSSSYISHISGNHVENHEVHGKITMTSYEIHMFRTYGVMKGDVAAALSI